MLVEEKLRLNPQLKLFTGLVAYSWDLALFDYDYEKAIKTFYDYVKELEKPDSSWYNGKHDGDCTQSAGKCARCFVESSVLEAEELMAKFIKL